MPGLIKHPWVRGCRKHSEAPFLFENHKEGTRSLDYPRFNIDIFSLVVFPALATKEQKSSEKELSNDVKFAVLEPKKLVGLVIPKLES